uniref:Variant surface glycoprotein (VSG), putative n=1 Tax=Trypanosoma brucei brucei (strain 927/4 GUTat10.1) TaxID=185431 RepID=Q4FKC8_TRYB2|nr:variant surface glycoprotein (VSG), putative [Trypanosoma brucei brucei TREU927]
MKTLWKLLLVAASCLYRADGAESEGKNIPDMNAVCDLIRLAHADVSKLPQLVSTAELADELRAINVSVADPEWAKQFPTTKQTEDKDAKPCGAAAGAAQCKAAWLQWQAASIKANEEGSKIAKSKPTADQRLTPTGVATAIAIAGITEEAIAEIRIFDEQSKPHLESLAQKIQKELAQAAYGADTINSNDAQRCEIAPTTNKETTCKLPAVGAALCVTAACICTKDGATNTQDMCGTQTTGSHANWGTGKLSAAYQPIDKACLKKGKEPLTVEAIASALAHFKARLRFVASGGTSMLALGEISAAANCAAKANEACADFTLDSHHKATTGHADNKWRQRLEAAMDLLAKGKAAAMRQDNLVSSLKAKKARALLMLKQLKDAPLLVLALTGQNKDNNQGAQKADDKKQQEAEKECNKKDKDTDCTAPCKWNPEEKDEKKNCTLSEEGINQAAEKANQETEEATKTGCGRHKTKTDC